MGYVIAIDGPAGAGKSTVAKILASKLEYKYLDTGAMYRAVTYLALKNKVDIDNSSKLTQLAEGININFFYATDEETHHILVNNQDITYKIRTSSVNKYVSEVAKVKGVRQALVKLQRKIASNGNIVMDGRDIGSRVLPDADFKFYITASLEERTRRRFADIKDSDTDITLKEIRDGLLKRDQTDKNRQESPLVKTDDAILIDTTDLNINEVIQHLLEIINGRERDG